MLSETMITTAINLNYHKQNPPSGLLDTFPVAARMLKLGNSGANYELLSSATTVFIYYAESDCNINFQKTYLKMPQIIAFMDMFIATIISAFK